MQDKILREAAIFYKREISEDEKKRILENPEFVQEQMKSALTGKPHAKLQNAYNDIKERHEDIIKLERVKKFFNCRILNKLQNCFKILLL
jgi:hypothetical protein